MLDTQILNPLTREREVKLLVSCKLQTSLIVDRAEKVPVVVGLVESS
jgi:hypothetical protein